MADLLSSGNLTMTMAFTMAIFVSGLVTFLSIPPIMRRMKEKGFVGKDYNKREDVWIPEMGGMAVLFGFPVGISLACGVLKLISEFNALPILAAIGVLYIGGLIGILDDISDISTEVKAFAAAFAALPLVIGNIGNPVIDLPFGVAINLSSVDLLFWIIIAPLAVTGAANALNMSAGYNGLETGQLAIISASLLVVALLTRDNPAADLIFAALFGCAIGLYAFNSHPAVVFVGNVGTFSTGAVIGAGVIIGDLEFAGLIAIAPCFFELFSTVYYSYIKKVDSEMRKNAQREVTIDGEGKMHPRKGSERYALPLFLLSRKPMNEARLVRSILTIYLLCGILAVILSVV
jgi:UDP-N-acetylglucosamine--dolichyl-phosphate N-acetylglucosaminephosphotransferase